LLCTAYLCPGGTHGRQGDVFRGLRRLAGPILAAMEDAQDTQLALLDPIIEDIAIARFDQLARAQHLPGLILEQRM